MAVCRSVGKADDIPSPKNCVRDTESVSVSIWLYASAFDFVNSDTYSNILPFSLVQPGL